MVASRVFRTLLCFTLFFGSLSLLAQQTGTIAGRVTDSSGAALPGVTVEAVSSVSPQPRVTVTNETGDYHLPALQPGTYTVSYSLAGLQDAKRRVNVVLNQTVTVDVSLGIAAQSEVITVTAEASLVDRESATLGAGLTNDQIQALPISQEYKDLQKLIPGVMVSQDTYRGPSAGGSGQDNVYLFDGVNVTMPLFGIMTTEPSTHDVAQFSVTKGGARAVDFERAGGFTVDSVSKSGSNEFKGEVSYQALNHNFIAESDNASNLRYDQDRSWANANFGGPILRDALYFYGSFYRPVFKRENQANLYGDLPPYKLERNEYFGKLTYAPAQAWLFNGSYRTSKREETNDTFGARQAASTGFGYETELKIGTFEGSWIPSSNMYATFKYTDFQNPGGGRPDTFSSIVPSFQAGTSRLDLSNLDKAGLLTVPTPIATNPTQSAFVAPYIDRYGFLQSGVRTGGGTIGTARYSADDDDFYRKAGQIAFNYSMPGRAGMSHDLHFGYQRSIDEEDRFQTANGWGSLTIPGGTVNCPASACGSVKPAFFQAVLSQQTALAVPVIHSEFHSQNIEVNDTIRRNNWTFNVGVLLSNDTLYGQGLKEANNVAGYVAAPGNKYKMHTTPFEEMIQPRLSATWAYNGSDTLFGSYARYNPAANSDARAASWDRNLVRDINAYFDENGVLLGIDPVASSSGKLFAELDARTVNEYMVGTGQQIGTGFSARVYGRYRYGNNFWEDTNNDARIRFGSTVPGVRQALYIPDLGTNPSGTTPGTGRRGAIGSGSSYVIAELDGAFTKYYEGTVESDYNKGRMFLRGSYTWSHYYGNFDQDNSSTPTGNDAAIFIGSSNIGDGAGRQLWDNKYGDLRGDRRHILKAYGTYSLPWNATAGAFGLYQSGQPYQLESFIPYKGLTTSTSDTNRYAEPAGRRRSPAHHQVDLNYTQNIGLPRNLNLQIIADIFNIYDKQTGYNYETRVGTIGTCTPTATAPCAFATGLDGELAYLRRAPYANSFYDPRRFQLRARLQF